MKKVIFLPIVFIPFLFFISCEKKVVEVQYAPVLYNVTAPDSLARGDTLIYLVSVMAFDPDGAGDIDSVYFISTKPDSTSNGNHFALNDDGQMGDETAGDNLYSSGIQSPPADAQLGNYIFTFYARDKNGNKSNNPTVTVTVY